MKLEEIIDELNRKATQMDFSGEWEYEDLSASEEQLLATYNPAHSFIVYGTLGPGGPNHHVVAQIPGKWCRAIIRGRLEKDGWGAEQGYNGFRHAEISAQQEIPAMILISEYMPENWQRLDEFEGDGYRRILAKYELESGEIGVGYIYGLK